MASLAVQRYPDSICVATDTSARKAQECPRHGTWLDMSSANGQEGWSGAALHLTAERRDLQTLFRCLQVLQSMTEEQRAGLTPIKLRRKARDFALKAVSTQRDQFKRCAGCHSGRWQTTCLTAYKSCSCPVSVIRKQVSSASVDFTFVLEQRRHAVLAYCPDI